MTGATQVPASPTGTPYREHRLEQLIAAVIAADGWYVERGLEFPNLCEADVIGTRLTTMTRRMAEAKSGNSGAGDAFKFESQRRYLNIDHGAMFVPATASREMDDVATWGGFTVYRTDLTRPNVIAAVCTWLGNAPTGDLIDAWERAYRAADALVTHASDSKARLASPTLRAIWTAFHGVNAPAWVRMTLEQRCDQAYRAFSTLPHAGLARAREIDGSASGQSPAFREAWAFGRHPSIQATLLLEWTNRLEVLRLAAEYALSGGALGGTGSTLFASTLPFAFRLAVTELRRDPSLASSLPVLLHALVFRWGGFLIPDTGEDATLGAEFGLTAAQVAECLEILRVALPPSSGAGWLRSAIGANWMMLVPYPVQGLGVMYRDVVRPGWDATLNGTLKRVLREREAAVKTYL